MSKPIQAFILDDDVKNNKLLIERTHKFFNIINISNSSTSVKDVFTFLKSEQFSILFINQSLISDTNILKIIENNNVILIFIASFDNYKEAYNYHALNFLENPFANTDLILNINSALRDIDDENFTKLKHIRALITFINNNGKNCDYMVVKSLDKIEYVLKKDIIKIEFDGRYNVVHLKGNKILISTMKFDDY